MLFLGSVVYCGRRILIGSGHSSAFVFVYGKNSTTIIKDIFSRVFCTRIKHYLLISETLKISIQKRSKIVSLQIWRYEHIVQVSVNQENLIQFWTVKNGTHIFLSMQTSTSSSTYYQQKSDQLSK